MNTTSLLSYPPTQTRREPLGIATRWGAESCPSWARTRTLLIQSRPESDPSIEAQQGTGAHGRAIEGSSSPLSSPLFHTVRAVRRSSKTRKKRTRPTTRAGRAAVFHDRREQSERAAEFMRLLEFAQLVPKRSTGEGER